MKQLIRVAELTHELNVQKNRLYVLGYMMQEAGEFADAVVAFTGMDPRFVLEHPEHDIEEGADVVQNVISNLAMVTNNSPENLVDHVFTSMGEISEGSNDPVATSSYSDDNLSMLMMSIGRLSESTMIASGDITHKDHKPCKLYYNSALVIHNVISIIQSNRPTLSLGDVVIQICNWIEKKNEKWISISK